MSHATPLKSGKPGVENRPRVKADALLAGGSNGPKQHPFRPSATATATASTSRSPSPSPALPNIFPMADSDNESGGNPSNSNRGGELSAKEQDRFLPIANVSRIMKKALPANAKISKDAKETVQECVSEFISFITGEASDKCQREKRKTINGDDLLWAMTTLGFEEYVEPLKVYLHRYREMEGDKASSVGRQQGEKDTPATASGDFNGMMMMMGHYHPGQVYTHAHAAGFHHSAGPGGANGRTR